MNKILKLDNFVLKIIACVTMVLDHVGMFLSMYLPSSQVGVIVTVFRTIGRLAYPLFAFLIVEGALKTKSLPKYILRVGIMAVAIAAFLLVFQYSGLFGFVGNAPVTNIFLQFTLCLVSILCLNLKRWKKALALLPFAYVLFVYISTAVKAPYMGLYPKAFVPDYGIYGYILVVGAYLLLKFYSKRVDTILNDEEMSEAYKQTGKYQFNYNMLAATPLVIMSLLITVLRYVAPMMLTMDVSLQSYACLAVIPMIFYSGKLGINNKFVKYGFYAFYPVHIILIWLIFTLIYL